MQMDGRTQTYGRRETTLIGYPPAPPAQQPEMISDVPKDLVPPAAAPRPGHTTVTAPYGTSGEAEPAVAATPNLAANLVNALAPEPDTILPAGAVAEGTFLAPAGVLGASRPLEPRLLEELEPIKKGERRNPRSRRLPINRGRHLSRTFFEEGDKQEQTGWENSPLAEEPFGASSTKLGFTSFDRVPRKRGPLIAAAAGIGLVAAILGAWALGGSSGPDRAKPGADVWSALRVPGAGWQPPAPTPTTVPRPAPSAIAPQAPPVTAPQPARPAVAPAPAAVAKPLSPPKAPAAVAFAPTRDVAKAPAAVRPPAQRVSAPSSTGARRHAVAARRVQPRPATRTPVPVRARVKSAPAPAVPVAPAEEAAEAPAAHEAPALPAASAAPAPAAIQDAPAAEPESAPGDVP